MKVHCGKLRFATATNVAQKLKFYEASISDNWIIEGNISGIYPLDNANHTANAQLRIFNDMRFVIVILSDYTGLKQSKNGQSAVVDRLSGHITLENDYIMFKVDNICKTDYFCGMPYPVMEAGRPMQFSLKLKTDLEHEDAENLYYDYQGEKSEFGGHVKCPDGKSYFVQSEPGNPNKLLCENCGTIISKLSPHEETLDYSWTTVDSSFKSEDVPFYDKSANGT